MNSFLSLKILALSMNIAKADKGKIDIPALAKAIDIGKEQYDLVIIAEQETKLEGNNHVCTRLAKHLEGTYTCGFDDADPMGKSRITMTGSLIIGGGLPQCVGVLWKPKYTEIIVPFKEKEKTWEKVKGKRKWGIFNTAKGGVVFNISIGGNVLSFAGCHLNDKKAASREEELDLIVKAMPEEAALKVIMGDMNYRPQFESNAALTPDDFFRILANEKERAAFIKRRDPISKGAVKLHGFTFPEPDFLPTYKRTQGVPLKEGAKDNELKKAYWTKSGGPKEDKTLTYDQPDATSVEDAGRAGEYGIGWLDRIGYKGKGKVTELFFTAFHNITFSDHTPVGLCIHVEIPKHSEKP
jgi:hypothetical protein